MTIKRTPRPRDPIQLGKLMVDIATGAVPDSTNDGKDAEIMAAARKAGQEGGKARALSLGAKRRKEIAAEAAKVRWEGNKRQVK